MCVCVCQAQSSDSDNLKVFCTFDGSVVFTAISKWCCNHCSFYRCTFLRFKNRNHCSLSDGQLALINFLTVHKMMKDIYVKGSQVITTFLSCYFHIL